MNDFYRPDVLFAAEGCEFALIAEREALDRKDFEDADYWASAARSWSERAFFWAALGRAA